MAGPDEYYDNQCPNCGWDSQNGDSDLEAGQVRYGPPVVNIAAEMEHGGTCLDWTETWICQECGTEFEFENSSY